MSKLILKDALKNHYAVGAFNFSNLEVLKAIVAAGNKTGKPIIAQVSKGAIEFMGFEYLKNAIKAAKKEAKVPVCFHLDHGDSLQLVKTAIKLGCDSVMIDASHKSFEENIKITKEVVEYAHTKGVWTEAELGRLAGVEEHVNVNKKDSLFTNPKEAKLFVEKTGVDSLAIAIGTSHGAYKFEGESTLRFDILSNLQKLLPDTPLVLHGASSVDEEEVEKFNKLDGKLIGAKGVDEKLLKKAATTNVCKINVDTDLRLTFTRAVLEHIKNNPSNIDMRKYLNFASNEVQKTIENKINTFNSK